MQALVIIDVQNDYFPGGRSELVGAVEALDRIKAVLKQFREKNHPIIFVKHAPNSFFQTNLLELLQTNGVGELVVCGMMTHMCIDTTVRAAKDYGIPVTLLYDACATKDLNMMGNCIPAGVVHNTYMAGLSGMFAEIRLTEEFEL